MKRAVLAIGIGLISTQAHAHHRHHHHARHHVVASVAHNWVAPSNGNATPFSYGPRPRAWCGFYMRQLLGVADAAYNLARNWTHYGRHADGPASGMVVVFAHHVGLLVRPGSGGRWIVKSGNDGHRVRERERSIVGAIAFRSPS